jgi:hypothetical protein
MVESMFEVRSRPNMNELRGPYCSDPFPSKHRYGYPSWG